MNEIFVIFAIFAGIASLMVITLTAIVLTLLKSVRELEDELEANLPPF